MLVTDLYLANSFVGHMYRCLNKKEIIGKYNIQDLSNYNLTYTFIIIALTLQNKKCFLKCDICNKKIYRMYQLPEGLNILVGYHYKLNIMQVKETINTYDNMLRNYYIWDFVERIPG